jgi:S-adenosylmethionine uptake transporter
MLASAACFAVMATCVAGAHRLDPALPTAVASTLRAAVNLVALVGIARGDLRRLVGDARPALWLRGVLGAASLVTYFAALARLGAGEAAFLNNTSALWVAVVAPLLLGERTPHAVWAALGVSAVGLLLLVEPRDHADGIGRMIGLTSGLCAAGAYLSVRRAGTTNSAIAVVFWFTSIATIGCAAWWAASGFPGPANAGTTACLVGSGLAATAGQLLMTEAYRRGNAAPVAAAGAAGPLLTALLAWGLLGQVPDPRAGLGIAILLVGAVLLPFACTRPIPVTPAGARPSA